MVECARLSFLDAYAGYHQIKIAVEDEEKIAFINPCGTYCYICTPFGLKNAGSTFQRAIQAGLGPQLHRNVEAYMDGIFVKTKESDSLIDDLQETFHNLNKMRLKLNPEKCIFGVPSGKLLGFLVSHRGIKVNPDKILMIEQMQAPKRIKDVQWLHHFSRKIHLPFS